MKISEHCYVIHGLTALPPWMVNAGFIVGNEKTLIIDTGYNYLSAQTIFGYATAARPENRLRVVNTEPHSDHMGGNGFFRERGVDVYGHRDTRRSEDELNGVKAAYNASITNPVRRERHEEDVVFHKTRFVNPNLPVSKTIAVDLGDLGARIIPTPGHTAMNLSVYVPSDRVLFSGDTIISGYIPHLAEGTAEDWEEWLESIQNIYSLSIDSIIPGHGEVLKGRAVETAMNGTAEMIRKAIMTGTPPAP